MEKQAFEDRLRELSALVGLSEATELFNQGYEGLHKDLAGQPREHRDFLLRLRTLGFLQQEYLMNLWLKLKRQTEMI